MKITTRPHRLEFNSPFRLSVGERTHTDLVYVILEDDGLKSIGEASMPPYLGESTKSVLAFIDKIDPIELRTDDLQQTHEYLDSLSEGDNAAKAAIETAVVSMAALEANQSIEYYLNIEDREIFTAYTIGISEENELKKKLEEAASFKTLKLKLGSVDDLSILRTIGRLTEKPFSVDVNQGWESVEVAMPIVKVLEEMGCLFIEQPFGAEDLYAHAELKTKTDIPIFADESIKRLEDLEKNHDAFDGVVVKLMKSAGPLEALQMLRRARELGLKTVIGCMAESSVAIFMARILAPLADYADLDGAFLVKNDPYKRVTYQLGKVILNS